MSTGNAWTRNDRKGRDKATNDVQGTAKPRDAPKVMEILLKGTVQMPTVDCG